MVDADIADILRRAGVGLVVSLPCATLAGILAEIDRLAVRRISVCREEEGVGIAAGAALAGTRAALVMQNSGLGNCVNALASLTCFYRLPLFMLMSHRGGAGEKIAAQVPMGRAAPLLLDALSIGHLSVAGVSGLRSLEAFVRQTFDSGAAGAAFLSPELWDAQK